MPLFGSKKEAINEIKNENKKNMHKNNAII